MSRGRRILTALTPAFSVFGIAVLVAQFSGAEVSIWLGVLSLLTIAFSLANLLVLARDQNRAPIPGRRTGE